MTWTLEALEKTDINRKKDGGPKETAMEQLWKEKEVSAAGEWGLLDSRISKFMTVF